MDLLESNRSVFVTAAFGERAVAQIQPITDKQPFKLLTNSKKDFLYYSVFCCLSLSRFCDREVERAFHSMTFFFNVSSRIQMIASRRLNRLIFFSSSRSWVSLVFVEWACFNLQSPTIISLLFFVALFFRAKINMTKSDEVSVCISLPALSVTSTDRRKAITSRQFNPDQILQFVLCV